jgi:maltose alpha-D-glucosyltransferase / alpha-amylase
MAARVPLPLDPLWYKDAVIYQLHVKSFFDSNDDGIGDFPGLTAKLDYIERLGVTALWLLPFYPSPRRDDGYDIADYRNVHPDYGTMDDVRALVDAAHARNIRVITELVVNHTSDQHAWFQRARLAPAGSVERDFYVWSDTDQKYLGTRIIFLDTEKSNWTWDPVANAYFWHRFYSHQPDLNYDNPLVLQEVLSVMEFWLDLGIDGLRLDAVPYLVERDGTNNENLPETHTILKKIRAALDAKYQDRMLLAEANQWPEDTQEYFGQEDECHMAFHFPLMPRMYMAIAKEDRFPITDIMRQTPQIPPTCQWAIFLRNHDELTLEMVTDNERDYLWEVYASDRRARINLGIRRRLGPLLERDRRRMELMNSLLLSMPGTPVVYYGDEIGMGDNIHLGDRDGVRTPMQWSPDRNGGFSRADAEQLVLPVIANPLYGYASLNVESQTRDAHSLLNWMRRMLALRSQHQVFGRGSLEFLYPSNRKVFAYLRRDENETILCVANLARAPQAVELDLREFKGRVPVEMTGGSAFPPIGELTYLLTLPPYGFYWFEMRTADSAPEWRVKPPEMLSEYATLVIRRGMADIVSESTRAQLQRDVLPSWLQARRWFGAKDRPLDEVRLTPIAALDNTAEAPVLFRVTARFGNEEQHYLLPLGLMWENQDTPLLAKQLALANVRRTSRMGVLTDAFAIPAFARILIDLLARNATVSVGDTTLCFRIEADADLSGLIDAPIRWLSAEQSNSSLVYDDRAVLKLLRHPRPGVQPEAELGRELRRQGVTHVAPFLGEIAIDDGNEIVTTIGILHGFVRNQGDAWQFTLDYLSRLIDQHVIVAQAEPVNGDFFAEYDAFAAAIGRALGELHRALAASNDDPAFAPEDATPDDVERWREHTLAEIDRAFAMLDGAKASPAIDELAARLRAQRKRLIDRVRALHHAGHAIKTRTHGDFHLGQILVSSGEAIIVDFEGEPHATLEQRRAKTSPLRDVAGLLRSLHYAAASIGARDDSRLTPAMREARDALLARFLRASRSAFLGAYTAMLGDGEVNPSLLTLFVTEKAAYELCYELANRPDWVHVPLRGLIESIDAEKRA